MKRISLVLAFQFIVAMAWGQSEDQLTSAQAASSFIGLNIGHAALIGLISSSAGYTYLPIHLE
jgi:hypothetical protein